jgi:hypothetical protein
MKTSPFDNSGRLWKTAFVAIICLCGCRPPSNADFVGTYDRGVGSAKESFSIYSNGTFKQTIDYADGRSWLTNGTWSIHYKVIQLDRCFELYDDEKQTVMEPPRVTYSFTLEKSGHTLSRSDLQPSWEKRRPEHK